jgi:hypothetical protein
MLNTPMSSEELKIGIIVYTFIPGLLTYYGINMFITPTLPTSLVDTVIHQLLLYIFI